MAIPVDHAALPVRAWVQVVTTQSVVARGITSLLEGSHGDLVITSRVLMAASRTWSSST